MNTSFSRRRILLGAVFCCALPRVAFAQARPVFLPSGITSPLIFGGFRAIKKEQDLGGWLLCNGAEVSRTEFKALFEALGPNALPGDGRSTFNLPNDPCQYGEDGAPLIGWAISWSEPRCGLPAGTTMPFDATSNI